MDFYADAYWDKAFEYRPGQKVEFKSQPGTFDTVACYEPMMVPPHLAGERSHTPLPSPTASNFDRTDGLSLLVGASQFIAVAPKVLKLSLQEGRSPQHYKYS